MNIPIDYFEEIYKESDDPFRFDKSWYETRKYNLTLAALPHPKYNRTFEPGCSIGVLTSKLAARTHSLESWDISKRAVEIAQDRVTPLAPNVQFKVAAIPDDWPTGLFDLIVLSEMLYYFDEETLGRVIAQSLSSLSLGGTLVTTHWRHERNDQLWIADEIKEFVESSDQLINVSSVVDPDFLVDAYINCPRGQQINCDLLSVSAMYGVRG